MNFLIETGSMVLVKVLTFFVCGLAMSGPSGFVKVIEELKASKDLQSFTFDTR